MRHEGLAFTWFSTLFQLIPEASITQKHFLRVHLSSSTKHLVEVSKCLCRFLPPCPKPRGQPCTGQVIKSCWKTTQCWQKVKTPEQGFSAGPLQRFILNCSTLVSADINVCLIPDRACAPSWRVPRHQDGLSPRSGWSRHRPRHKPLPSEKSRVQEAARRGT